jgi:hypothetical protein
MTADLRAPLERLIETLKAKRHVSTLPGMDGMVSVSAQTIDDVLALLALPAETPAPETWLADQIDKAKAEIAELPKRVRDLHAPETPPADRPVTQHD